jgi:hypothetical protein
MVYDRDLIFRSSESIFDFVNRTLQLHPSTALLAHGPLTHTLHDILILDSDCYDVLLQSAAEITLLDLTWWMLCYFYAAYALKGRAL